MTDLEKHQDTAAPEVTFTDEQMDLIKRTVLKPAKRQATNDELAFFAYQARRTGLDPLTRQIYGIYRFDKRAGGEVMTVQTSVDGLRLIAQRSGRYDGQTETLWADQDGRWHDVWLSDAPPAAAKAGVRLKGVQEPTLAVARFRSYFDQRSPMWKTMPDVMIAKCAESLALRKAFPAELSGIYTSDEMGQADQPSQPAPSQVSPAQQLAQLLDRHRATDDTRAEIRGWIAPAGKVDQDRVQTAITLLEAGETRRLKDLVGGDTK